MALVVPSRVSPALYVVNVSDLLTLKRVEEFAVSVVFNDVLNELSPDGATVSLEEGGQVAQWSQEVRACSVGVLEVSKQTNRRQIQIGVVLTAQIETDVLVSSVGVVYVGTAREVIDMSPVGDVLRCFWQSEVKGIDHNIITLCYDIIHCYYMI